MFQGWCTDAACKQEYNFDTPVTAPVTLYAKWTPQIIVTFDAAGGSEVGSLVIASGTSIDDLPDSTREGFYFAGWYQGENPVGVGATFDSDTTLTARWTPNIMSVTFVDGEDTYDIGLADYASAVARPADPQKEGYTFLGWYTEEGVEYDFTMPVTGDLTLHAAWAASGDPTHTEDDEPNADNPDGKTTGDAPIPTNENGQATSNNAAKSASASSPATGDGVPAAPLAALAILALATAAQAHRLNKTKKTKGHS